MVLNFDLNDPPAPAENFIPLGGPIDLNLTIGLPWDGRLVQVQTTPQLESMDDEVVICSPRSFAEAREKARRNRGVVEVIDTERDFRSRHSGITESTVVSFPNGNNRRKGGSTKRTNVNGDLCWINLECNEIAKNYCVAEAPKAPIAEAPKAPSFSCPVCMGPFVEETSTKCGHIFCKKCIYGALAAQSKCPTCRRKLKAKDTIRIYLPISD